MVKNLLMLALGLLALLGVTPARAQTSADVRYDYALYLLGLPTADIRTHLAYTPAGYTLDVTTQTTGVAEIFISGNQLAQVHGRWTPDGLALPLHYDTHGTWNGDPHSIAMDFAGGVPTVTERVPAEKKDHMAIPPALMHDAIDTLSGFATMVRQIVQSGRCDQHAHTFDGLHILDVTAHTVGPEQIAKNDRSAWSGTALRCDFEGKMIAGFTVGEEAKQRHTLHATAWLAKLTPDGPPMPVRAKFETRYFGDATVYLKVPEAVAAR